MNHFVPPFIIVGGRPAGAVARWALGRSQGLESAVEATNIRTATTYPATIGTELLGTISHRDTAEQMGRKASGVEPIPRDHRIVGILSSAYDPWPVSDPPRLDGVRHEYINAAGLPTHVALAGPEDAPPIVLVHGWPQNWWAWRRVIPGLAERFRVITPDLRGHGWTEAPATGYEKEQLASDLLGLLDELGIERVTWVGHDWGGWTGMLAALRAPERFDRMLAVGIPHLWVKPTLRRLLVGLSYQGPVSLPLVGPRISDPMVRRILQVGRGGDRLPEAEVGVFAEHLPASVTVAMYRTFLTRELPPIIRGRYADAVLQVPTTMLLGSHDQVTEGITAGPVDGQPQLHVETLDDVAHWVPEQRSQAIIDWSNGG